MNKWLILFLLGPFVAKAQDVVLNLQDKNPIQIGEGFALSSPENNSEYLSEKWSKGKLFYTNGTSKIYDSLNFNRTANLIEVVLNNKVLTLMPQGLAGSLIYDSIGSGSVLIVGKVDMEYTFLLTHSVGSYILASYLTTNKIEEVKGYKIDEVRFIPRKVEEEVLDQNFVLFEDGNWKKIKLSKSTLSKLFKQDKKELQSIASGAKLHLNDKADLIKLFQVLNKK